MKKCLLSIVLLMSAMSYAQIGVGTIVPDNSSQMEVVSSDKGVLIPRIALQSSADNTTITNGNKLSLLVFNTSNIADITPGYYYWDGAKWQRFSNPDDVAAISSGLDTNTTNISLTEDGTNLILTDSDGGTVTIPLATVSASLGEDVTSTSGVITGGQPDAALVAMDLDVADGSIETVHIADVNITTAKIADDNVTVAKVGATLADANKILGTDATGNAEWQDATTVATSLGEDVSSTNGSITGGQADAALVAMDLEVNVDDTTIEVDAVNGVQVKDDGITTAKIGTAGAGDANKILGTDAAGDPEWQDAATVSTSLGEDVSSTNGSITGGQADAALVAMDLEVNVDDTTIEVDAVNGVQVKDDGVTTAKIGTAGAGDANKILGTDAAGDPEWQDAATVSASLGEDVTSTSGVITGGQPDAALVAMDLDVADGSIETVHIADVNITTAKIADDGVTTAKIGTAGAGDANKILGTDAAGDPEWQDAATVSTSLGEDVTSTSGVITGGQPDAALVAMDLDVADGSIETVHIADANVTTAKIADDNVTVAKVGATLADANKILGTDATGNAEWQDATTVATSLGEDVSSTNGSITGGQADAALVAMDLEVNVDDTTIEVDAVNGVQVKDDGVTTAKIGTAGAGDANKILGTDAAGDPEWQDAATVSNSLGEDVTSTSGVITGGQPDAALVAMDLDVADGSIETVHIADANITTAKIADDNVTVAKVGATLADANKILGTDAAGDPEWQDAATVSTSLGEDVTSTSGVITGGQPDAALVAMDLDVADGSIETVHIADANVTTAKIADDGVTTAKIGTVGAGDANKILGTDAAGDPEWQDAATVATSLGEDVTSTSGVITGGQADAALVAMDLDVADGSIETVHIADANITTAKIADDGVTTAKIGTAGAGDANKILGTDAAGDPEWQDAATVATSLGEDVTSTSGVITGGQPDAALVAMDLDVADGSIETVHIADANVTTAKIADDNVTVAKVGATLADANKILGTDATGNAEWQDATTVATSLGEDVSSTNGSITGGQADAALVAMDLEVNVDDTTIEVDAVNGVQVKDDGITTAKIGSAGAGDANKILGTDAAGDPEWQDAATVATSLGEDVTSTSGVITGGQPDAALVAMDLDVADGSIETVHIADANITTAKIADDNVTVAKVGATLADANKILGTDAAGNAEWQDATTVATSLGEDVSSTNGSITGGQADAALVAMDLEVNVDDITIEVDAVNGVQVKDDGITTAKIGTAGAGDANKILGTDAAGDPEWQDAATVSTSLGEDVTSTSGVITGGQPDAALVAMDLDVADGSIETVHIADANITTTKIADDNVTVAKVGATLADANKILGTDATGNAEWQDATTVATSLGEDVSSTNGSITGGQADAALVAMDLEVNVDDTTIEVDAVNGVQVKDDGITTAKIGTAGAGDANKILGTDAAGDPEWQDAATVSTSLGEDVTSTSGVITGGQPDAALVAMDLDVADGSIETVHIADDNVTVAKVGATLADANKILGTDATGNAEWQDATTVATSLGEDVTSTSGVITGGQPDAALVAMDLDVADGSIETVHIADANITTAKIADDNVTVAKVGATLADANKILGTDATGNAEWQDATTVATSLGEDVTSTSGVITGGQPDAALVAMDLDVADGSIETVHIADANITTAKIADDNVTVAKVGATLADANKILGTDATGNAEWQDATTVATSLGEDVTSTSGVITGGQPDAALVAMDLDVADGSIETVHIADANITTAKIADDGVTTAKIGTAGAGDANKILGTDAAGDPEWQDAATVATSLGEDVTSTSGVITGGQADAALVAMDLDVADGSIETVHIADANITTAKIADDNVTVAKVGATLADANKILGTDATGNAEWQDATTVATSLGEDVSSTNGSITGGQADAALVAMDLEVNVDDTTIEVDAVNGVQVKDDGVTTAKIGTAGAGDANKILGTDAAGDPEWQDAATVATSLGEDVTSTSGVITGGQPDAALVAMDLDVADGSIETVHIADANITTTKIADDNVTVAKVGATLADANKILGTDATGNAEWQDATTVATSLGEDVTSTSGVITGGQADAALVAMDLDVADGSIETVHIADANITTAKIADDGVTTAKIGTAGAGDANKILGTDAAGDPEWQDAATVATSLGEDVTSTSGVITGGQADAALVAMDLDVADGSIETIHIADANVTTAKIADDNVTVAKVGATLADANKILGTDATGNAEWQDATTVATSLGEDVTSTSGVITGGQPDAALVAMDLDVADGSIETVHIADANITTTKIADDNVTVAKVGATLADANKILGTDATGNAEWQDATTVATSLGEDVTSTSGVITGGQADAALVAMDLDVADGSIETVHIADANVTTAKIADDNVTVAKVGATLADANKILGTDATGNAEWQDATTVATSLGEDVTSTSGVITGGQADAALVAMDLDVADGSIETVHIADANVTTAKIADDNVTVAKVGATLADANKILGTDATGNAEWQDATTVATSLGEDVTSTSGVITGGQADAALVAMDLDVADGSIETVHIADANITTAKIADDNVTVAKIVQGTDGQVLTTVAGETAWADAAAETVTTLTAVVADPNNYEYTSEDNTVTTISPDLRVVNGDSHITIDAGPGGNGTSAGGTRSIIMGAGAGAANTGNANIFIGHQAGEDNTSATNNLFMGVFTGFNTTIGNQNTFLGNTTGLNNTTGANNTYLGFSSGIDNVTGSDNVFIGHSAGLSALGDENVFLGTAAGSLLASGSDNIVIGTGAQFTAASVSNSLNIGNLIYGNGLDGAHIDGTPNAISTGNIGIGVENPTEKLDIDGKVRVRDLTEAATAGDLVVTADPVTGVLKTAGVASKVVADVYSAEYAGATLFADGSDNLGMMTSDNTGATGNWMNYYEWSSGEATAQDYDVIFRFTLPNDFTAWDVTNPIVIDYQAQGTSNFSATMFLENGTALGTIAATSSVAWATANLNPGAMAAGDTAVIILKLTSAPNDDTQKVRIGDITLNYIK
ncbi:beta strand repeat-containing protein [Spongiimicrobium sp. 3-5]|uniref:beta strand repeat-containing protein n=1 Tax=Spongiimicrobium sp. 3-5 TaxID=3332596 RepID=UPI00397EEFCB